MAEVLDTVLLLALPASGKSEVRRFLKELPASEVEQDFHLGPNVQLDDFPYVHLMRRVDEECHKIDHAPLFFQALDKPFIDGRDWGTLIELINEDYASLSGESQTQIEPAARHMMRRIDQAATRVGLPERIFSLPSDIREGIEDKLEKEATELMEALAAERPGSLDGKTIVIEFARGGPDGSDMPLKPPYGYAYSLSRLSPKILERASILYVWVTPEESRRKNEARADPDDPGSILHHGVPIDVMLGEYGCDDMDWLEQNAKEPGTLHIERDGQAFDIPIGRFDNRVDRTSFVREDKSDWGKDDVDALSQGLKGALDAVWGKGRKR